MIDLPVFKLTVMAEDTHAITACLGEKDDNAILLHTDSRIRQPL